MATIDRLIRFGAGFAAHRLGLSRLPYLLHRVARGRHMLVAIAYHRIIDSRITESFYTDYDRGLDRKIFRYHLESLRKHFRMVTLDEFLDYASGRRKPTHHSALLTFDDADFDFMHYALPLLLEMKVPAVVMAPTALIGSTEQLWHVRMSNVIRCCGQKEWDTIRARVGEWALPVTRVVQAYPVIPAQEERRELTRAVNFALDEVNHDEVDLLVEEWERICTPPELLPIRCMDWEQLKMLEEAGILVESHSDRHRKLTYLPDGELRCELVKSKSVLEERLGKKVRAITYPQGRVDDRVAKASLAAGYEVGFTTVRKPCNYPLSEIEMMMIPRLDVDGYTRSQLDLRLAKLAVTSLLTFKPW